MGLMGRDEVEISSPIDAENELQPVMKEEEYIPKTGHLTLLTKLSTGVSAPSQVDGRFERVLCKLTGGNLQIYSILVRNIIFIIFIIFIIYIFIIIIIIRMAS